MTSKPKVVVLGGGNGTSRLLQALKPLVDSGDLASLHALVLNADDGGSTGRVREQYGVAAMGDITKCLLALSGFEPADRRGQQLLRALSHRFSEGDFKGHTLRNMFLTGLESSAKAEPLEENAGPALAIDDSIALMARILQLPKQTGVVPTTLKALTQEVVVVKDGQELLREKGQHYISHQIDLQQEGWVPLDVKVQFAEGDEPLNPRAQKIIDQATHIIVAPGHTYGTILPTLALPSLGRAVAGSSAKLLAVMTLLTTPGQTAGWTGEDFVKVYEKYLGRSFDGVIANTGTAELELEEGQDWVQFEQNAEHSYQLISADLVSAERPAPSSSDVVPRAIVVHDSEKVAKELERLLVG